MADPLKFDGWRARFWKINGNLRIFAHLVYRKKQEGAVGKFLAEMSGLGDK
jgi:hypothetical protein